MANVKRAALVKARERRVALDRDRASRDGRVEQAAARVFLGVEQREAADRAVHEANLRIGRALHELLAERIPVENIAQLCELDTSEVRRLVRLAGVAAGEPGAAQADAVAVGEPGDAGEQAAGSATVTQLRRRPPGADQDDLAAATAVAVQVPGNGEAAGAARRAE